MDYDLRNTRSSQSSYSERSSKGSERTNRQRRTRSIQSDDSEKITIKELDLEMIRPRTQDTINFKGRGGKYVVIGAPGTGKTTLIASLLYAKKHIIPTGIVFSGTEDSNGFYRQMFPSTFVYNKYSEEQIKKFISRQKIAIQHLENPWGVLLVDDCTDEPAVFRKPLQLGLYKQGRHWAMLYILSLQYCMDVRPAIRTNIDGCFILRESNLKNRKALYENYASVIPDFKLFCDIMDQLTEDHTALYINRASETNNWKECVFFYKATPIPEGFKFGCNEYWQFHFDRYNPEYKDPLMY